MIESVCQKLCSPTKIQNRSGLKGGVSKGHIETNSNSFEFSELDAADSESDVYDSRSFGLILFND